MTSCDFSLLPLEGVLGSGDKSENLTEGLQQSRSHAGEMQDSVGTELGGSSWVVIFHHDKPLPP